MSSLLLRSLTTRGSRQLLRAYSGSPFLLDRKKPPADDEFQPPAKNIITMNTDMSDEEAMAIVEEEMAQMEAEKEAKFVKDWKPGMKKRPLKVSYRLEDFNEEGKDMWTPRDKRCGALGIKLGMMPVWDDWGERHPCTVLYLDTNIVMGHKTMEKNGYMAIQVAAGERKRKNVKLPLLGQFKDLPELYEQPPWLVREFRVKDETCFPEIGTRIHARHFVPGQNVDIAGITKGKGFQGAMKRWGFSGMPATHGTSRSHRALGSTGQCQDPGRVFKGKKMAGRMGTDRVTVQNNRVVKIDRGRNLIYVRGSIPGNKGGFVEIRDSVKKPLWGTEKVADALQRPPIPTFEFDETVDGQGEPGFEEIMPLPDQDPFVPVEDEAA